MNTFVSKLYKKGTNFAVAFVVAVSGLTALTPLFLSSSAAAAPGAGTVTVTGNTTATENTEGWMFNRDASTSTPYEFNADTAAIGQGSLYVAPISGSVASNKFIAENFLLSDVADIDSVSYDYKIGPNGVAADYDQFYMNVYANFGVSSPTKFYDCRYAVLATSGSTSSFTTLTFDTDSAYPVTTRAGGDPSPFVCPSVPSAMGAGATIRAFAINVGDTSLGDAGVDGYIDNVVVNSVNGVTTYDFEPVIPACSADDTTFDTFSNGSVNGQNGWTSTGGFDQAIVTNDYGFDSFGCKSFRLSNAVTSGGFGNQTFSYSTTNEAGEADSTNGGQSGGTRSNYFEAQFDIASTQTTEQTGMSLSVSPDRGDGSRMSYLSFVDTAAGIQVTFYDVQGIDNPANFVPTDLGVISRTAPHTIKFVINYVDGPSNDVVSIYIDGVLVHEGTSWENYYRYDSESSAEQTPRTTDSLIFRAGGTAAPANSGKGFLFDNVLISTTAPVVVPPVDPTPPVTGGQDDNPDEEQTPVVNLITPIITSPASVLGSDTDANGATDVEGTNTDNAAAVDTDGSDGIIFGLAWYWWLLILAGATVATWWIIAAIRRRREEQ